MSVKLIFERDKGTLCCKLIISYGEIKLIKSWLSLMLILEFINLNPGRNVNQKIAIF